jgi:hypothetical protein
MTTLYKLTDQKGRTKSGMQWGEGIEHSATGKGTYLCSDGFIHAYESPLIALFMNPIHAEFSNPRMWLSEGNISLSDGLQVGCKTLKTIKEVKDFQRPSSNQRVAFGILSAKQVTKDVKWNNWADNWLSGLDRTAVSAYVYVYAYVYASASAYASAASYAPASAYAYTYSSSSSSAYAASYAASCAAAVIDFSAIAEQAMKY